MAKNQNKTNENKKLPEFMNDDEAPDTNTESTSFNVDSTNVADEQPMQEIPKKQPMLPDDVCPVCMSRGSFEKCIVTKTHIDQAGYGFEGLICPDCGIIRVAKRRDGKFIYGFENKWYLQEK